jgi:hypothetical protein
MYGRPWDPDETKFLRESYSVGVAVSDIADMLARTEAAVRVRVGQIRVHRPAWFIAEVRASASRKGGQPEC